MSHNIDIISHNMKNGYEVETSKEGMIFFISIHMIHSFIITSLFANAQDFPSI